MATLDEVISQMSEEDYFSDPIQFIIDSDLRIVSVPDRGIVAGVVGDKNVNRINFQMPRYYNGFDMSKFKTRINYVNAKGNPNYYTVTDLTIDGDLLIFSWLVDADVVAYVGTVAFSVNMVLTGDDGVIKQAFNTSNVEKLKALEGIQVDKHISYEEQVDLISKLEADLTKYISSGINQIQDEGAKVKKSLLADYVKMTEDVTSLKEDLSTKITKFYASNQGETHIADSDDGKIMDMMLYGKSEQKQYSGKNLINSDEYYSKYKQSDGTYKGTAKGLTAIPVPISKYIGTQITVSCKVIVPPDITAVFIKATINGTNAEGNRISSSKSGVTAITITPKTESDIIRISYGDGSSGIIVASEFQIEKGSEATSYEPYTGGQPSPSPDYPQEIKSVVNPTVKVCGKNLYDSEKYPIAPNMAIDANTGNTYTSSTGRYGATEKYIPFEYEGMKISFNKSMSVLSYNENFQYIKPLNHNNIIPDGTKYIRFDILMADKDIAQIEFGDVSTAYEPYHEQTVTLPYTLNAIPVSSGGNVTIDSQQYMADYVDVERGKLVRMFKEVVLDGTEKWHSEESYMVVDIPNFSYVSNDTLEYMKYLFCNKYKASTDVNNSDNIIFIRKKGNGVVIKDTLHQLTVDDWKKYLNDNPCIVRCLSAIPEEIDLTTEEITAFKSLTTYYPTTNISVNSEQLDGYTVFNYPISLANGWNYVKQQLNDNRDYIYDMDAQSAEAYVNSEYAVALTELEV